MTRRRHDSRVGLKDIMVMDSMECVLVEVMVCIQVDRIGSDRIESDERR